MSEIYTHGHGSHVVAAHAARSAADSAAYLLPHLHVGDRLLDLGCGPGSITVDLAAAVSPGQVVGIDSSAQVLDQARELAAAEGVEVDFQVADVYDLPFPDEAFDVVHAHQLLHHLGDPVAALGEARRVLRPGGLLAARDMDFGAHILHPPDDHLARWSRTFDAVHRANGGTPDAGRRLLGWVLAAGFHEVEATSSTWTFADPDRRRWWAEMWAARAVADPFAGRAIELGVADAVVLDEIAAAWLRWAEQPDGWASLMHGEVMARRPDAAADPG